MTGYASESAVRRCHCPAGMISLKRLSIFKWWAKVGNFLSSRVDTDLPAAMASAMHIALSRIVGFSRLC